MPTLLATLFANRALFKWLGIGVAGVGLFFLLRSFWRHPERLNPYANGYLTHARKLKADSTRWQADSVGLREQIAFRDSVIAKKDTAINILTSEARKAQDYASTYLSQLNSQIAQKDAVVDRMSEQETELAYYKALEANGTLSRLTPNIPPSYPEVVTAGLKTANREVIGRKVIDSLALAVGQVQQVNARLARGTQRTSEMLGEQIADIEVKKKGGIPVFRHKRRKQLTQVQDKLRSEQAKLNEELDLVKVLNGRP